MSGALRRFFATLAFLSRLGPARVLDEADMRWAMFHLPLCGAIIGLCACAPVLAGAFAGRPGLQGWLCVALSAWLTRGLHLDGLSDLADGAGQHLNPERFWTILKDSRCGSFGVVALVLALLGQATLYAEVLATRPAWVLPWVFVFGRCVGVAFGFCVRPLARPGLGGLFLAGARLPALVWAGLLALGPALWLDPPAAGLAFACALGLCLPLWRLARAVGGANGDFLGAAIVLGETAAAAALVLAV